MRIKIVLAALTFGWLAGSAAQATPTPNSAAWSFASTSGCKQINEGSTKIACVGEGSSAINGNEYSFTNASSQVITAAAYHTNPVTTGAQSGRTTSKTSKWTSDFLGEYSGYGLGVENSSAPDHAVDNVGGYDFIVFQLPAGTNWTSLSIQLSPFGTSEFMSNSILYGSFSSGYQNAPTSVTGFAGLNISTLTNNGFTELDTNTLVKKTTNLTVNIPTAANVQYVIVAASLVTPSSEMDYFKVNSITATGTIIPPPSVTQVPEPLTLSVFGMGVLGTVVARRRRKTRA